MTTHQIVHKQKPCFLQPGQPPSSTDGEGDDEMTSSGNAGFFISFDNKTTKRSKPKLKSRDKKVMCCSTNCFSSMM